MLLPTRWAEVGPGDRVLDPTGQMFHVKHRFGQVTMVTDRRGADHVITVDLAAFVPRVFEIQDSALGILRKHFTVEFLEEKRS